MASGQEQLFLELTNQTRLNPKATADKYGIGLNDGLAAGTISGDPMQPLAPNDLLRLSSQRHSDWMLAQNVFSHDGDITYRGIDAYPGSSSTTYTGSLPGERMAGAGYSFTGAWAWAENIAYSGTTGSVDLTSEIFTHFEGLFRSAGHRENTLNPYLRESGVAQVQGVFTADGRDWNASMLTHNFATSGSAYFVTGVAYTDSDKNAFYSVGEGLGGVKFTVGNQTSTTEAAGGYALQLAASDSVAVSIEHAGNTFAATVDLSKGNVKLDLVDGDLLQSSGNITLGDGASNARLLGAADLTLTGNAGDNRLIGGHGDDTIKGGGGYDRVVYAGNQADYTVVEESDGVRVTHSDHSASGDGTDFLQDVDEIIFADGSTVLGASQDLVTLSGTVHRVNGTTLSNVGLRLLDGQNNVIDTASSDANGAYSLDHHGGSVRLVADPTQRGQVDVSDALSILKMSIGMDPVSGPATKFDFVAADTNRDGEVNVLDALDVLRAAVGSPSQGAGQYVLLDPSAVADTQTAANVDYQSGLDINLSDQSNTTLEVAAVLLGDIGGYDTIA